MRSSTDFQNLPVVAFPARRVGIPVEEAGGRILRVVGSDARDQSDIRPATAEAVHQGIPLDADARRIQLHRPVAGDRALQGIRARAVTRHEAGVTPDADCPRWAAREPAIGRVRASSSSALATFPALFRPCQRLP